MNISFQEFEDSRKIWKYKDKPNQRELLEDYWFIVDGLEYTIKAGFWWNGASIPQFAWSLVGSPWSDEVYFGALIHDMLYGANLFERSKCDDIFYEINSMSGMGCIKNQTIYRNLQLFGGFAYRNAFSKEGIQKNLLINGFEIIK